MQLKMILLVFLAIIAVNAQDNFLDQNNQFQISWPLQPFQNEEIVRAEHTERDPEGSRQQFNRFPGSTLQNGAFFPQQQFLPNQQGFQQSGFGQQTFLPGQGFNRPQGVFPQTSLTNQPGFFNRPNQFFPGQLREADFSHLGSVQHYQSEGDLFQTEDGEDPPDFLLREELPERHNFETDVDSQRFDPFHQREAVMDFLDHHQFRQTPLVFHGRGDVPVSAPHHHHHHHHHHHQHHHHRGDHYQNNEEGKFHRGGNLGVENANKELGAPYLFNVHPNQDFDYNREVEDKSRENLQELLGAQRKVVESMKQEKDSDLKLIGDIGDRILTDLEDKLRPKRAVPLVQLLNDPKVHLDVPKTVENFGTVTKNALDDEKTPVFHVKNLLGSSKNTLLSALRIAPQNLIIPSDYEIIRTDRVGAINPNILQNNQNTDQTFQRMGQMVRESIRSGQDTANHIADMAYNTRNILHTSKHAIPRIIVPYSRTPALQKDKLVLVSPRIVDVSENRLEQKNPNLVKLGHIMDAVGLSNPNPEKQKLEKIILRKKDRNHDDPAVGQTLFTLENVKTSLGAKTLREFISRIRKTFKNILRHALGEEPKKQKKIDEDKEVNQFLEDLFDQQQPEPDLERVGAGLYLSPELYKPFMGQPTPSQLQDYLRENGDDVLSSRQNPSITLDPGTMEDFLQFLKAKQDAHLQQFKKEDKNDTNQDLGYVLGAINPLMFERNYNETLVVNNNTLDNPHNLFRKKNDTVGISMTISGPALKPFMGQAQPDAVQDLLDSYNREQDYNFVENDFEPDYSD